MQVADAGKKLIRTCSIWRALEAVGDTPSLLILEALWLGDKRFDTIVRHTGLQKALLSNRLKKLIDVGILSKELYTSRPKRFDYVLTQKGLDIYWVALMMLRWEKLWSKRRNSLKITLFHKTCGNVVDPLPLCASCHGVIDANDMSWREGPGLGWMEPTYTRRRQQKNWTDVLNANASLFTEAAEIMGDRWSNLILRSVFTGLRRFDAILEDTAMATNVLTERLAWLQAKGILTAVLYQSNPDRFEYRLTRKGQDYYPVLIMLQGWGDKYYGAEGGPPVLLIHKTCGESLNAYVGCSHCAGALQPQDMSFTLTGRSTLMIDA